MTTKSDNASPSNTPFPDSFDSLIVNANLATFSKQYGFGDINKDKKQPYGQLLDAVIAIQDNKISWIGRRQEALVALKGADLTHQTNVFDAGGQWVTPGLIDCHTHLVYAGNRSNEFEARLTGVSYKQISDEGGGIIATVSATRQASFDELYAQSERRLQAMLGEGVTSIEIKSGYGLNLETEQKMLQVARQLAKDYDITVKTSYLAAHAVPTEYKGNADAYIDAVCEWMVILNDEGLIDAVDGFMENIGFNKAQMTKVFDTAKSLGLPIKLHAEQLTDMDGSVLVAKYKGLSSDHLEYLSPKNVQIMAENDVVAVLLPGAFYTLKETQLPPMQALYEYKVDIALSTDCNPGTSPVTSLLLMLNMGCTLFAMTPEQALAGITLNAAKALGLTNKGRLEVGMDADLAVWDITRPADLAYLIGLNPLSRVMANGEWRG